MDLGMNNTLSLGALHDWRITWNVGWAGLISEQWSSGARWSWFMPWYDGTNEDGSPAVHADEAWWKDAMSQEFVVSREDLPSMEL